MRVIVCGSRGWTDEQAIIDRLTALPAGATIVVGYNPKTGRPRGADKMAYLAARVLGLDVECHPADWEQHGKRAGFVRNGEMAQAGADLCVAFWDGESSGTLGMITSAKRHKIPVEMIGPNWIGTLWVREEHE